MPGWLSFDNKYKGGGVLEAAVQEHLQVRPLLPILEPSSMGQLGVLIVCEVSVTNVKRNRAKEQNGRLPSRSDRLCCQKAVSFAAGEWLAGNSMRSMANA